MNEITSFRKIQRTQMFQERGGAGRARCDCCRVRLASDMHELINRNRTVGTMNETARMISYSKQLCVLLCRECHAVAHNPKMRDELFLINYDRYGFDKRKRLDTPCVVEIYEALKQEMPNLDIKLPEPVL